MEVAPDEVAILPGANSALAVYPDATWVRYDLARHVLSCMEFANCLYRGALSTDGPPGYIVRPLVGRH